jgi:hypothetical protein
MYQVPYFELISCVIFVQEDKLAEQERLRKQEEEQFFREEELREIAEKKRARERERRRMERGKSSSSRERSTSHTRWSRRRRSVIVLCDLSGSGGAEYIFDSGEIEGEVYLSALSAGAYAATLYVVLVVIGCQPWLNFPS